MITNDSSVPILSWTISIWSVTSFSYMVFVINCILSNRTWQFCFYFNIDWTCMISHIVFLSCLHHKTHFLIGLDTSVSYFSEITFIRSVTSLSFLAFVIDRILFDRSWQFNSDFHVDHTCMISHVVVLAHLHHRLHTVRSIFTVQYRIISTSHLYDLSRCCLVYFLW